MSIKLRELIRNVRACKSAAEERKVIFKENALIRTSFKQKVDSGLRHRNVAKLLYIHMLGYPTHFGQMEALKLIASNRFNEKRIGYLALMLLLDETHRVLMLVTNCLKNDLKHKNPYVVGLALCSMGNISSADIARDLANEVIKLFRSGNPYIKKKAALCAIRIIRKVPERIADFVDPAKELLATKQHCVLVSGIALIIEMLTIRKKVASKFRRLVPSLVKHLKNLLLAGYVSEFDVVGITDPFLQCKIIELLRILGIGSTKASEDMSDILAQVSINTEPSKNPGNAILYECVQTIMAIEAEDGLRHLAINILGRFLLHRDNNIRYVALNTLCGVIHRDASSIQRHKNHIVDCLKDPDVSIRRRALDLIYALVTKTNVVGLVRELVNYLSVTSGDDEFKRMLTDKIVLVTEKFSSNKLWHLNTLLSLVEIAGEVCRTTIPANAILVVGHNTDLQPYAVHRMYNTLKNKVVPSTALMKLALFLIGEYGNHLVSEKSLAQANSKRGEEKTQRFSQHSAESVLGTIQYIISRPTSDAVVKAHALNALMKLSTRLGPSASTKIKEMVKQYTSSMSVELQQRSCEYTKLLSLESEAIKKKIVATMPTPKYVKRSEGKGDMDEDEDDEDEDEGDEDDEEEDDDEEEEEEVVRRRKPKPTKKISVKERKVERKVERKAQSVLPTPQPKPSQAEATNILSSIFGEDSGGSTVNGSASPSPAPVSTPTPVVTSGPAPIKDFVMPVFDSQGIKIIFQCRTDPSKPGFYKIRAVFTNSNSAPITNFDMKVAVPPWMKKQIKPAASTTLLPNKPVYQFLQIINSSAKKPMMKVKLDFVAPNGQKVSLPPIKVTAFQ
mmetsp:Transcript_12682/g.18994  ORF Transcript_12682/g.18994 Transcript_12682/m.18994 type:complete len:844 (-) Transcript_12682:147-2678(-)